MKNVNYKHETVQRFGKSEPITVFWSDDNKVLGELADRFRAKGEDTAVYEDKLVVSKHLSHTHIGKVLDEAGIIVGA